MPLIAQSSEVDVHAWYVPQTLRPDGYTLLAATIVVVILIRSAASVIKHVARERTRREIAAYIAEGSMTPEQGERLMRAGHAPDPPRCG